MRYLKSIFACLLLFLISKTVLLAQVTGTSDGATELKKERPHIWLGLNLLQQRARTQYAGEHNSIRQDDWQPNRMHLGLNVHLSYRWLALRVGMTQMYTAHTYTYSHSFGNLTPIVYGTHLYNRTDYSHQHSYKMLRIPISLGIAPEWKFAPYMQMGMFIHKYVQAQNEVTSTFTTVTTRNGHSPSCSCSWSHVNQETLPTETSLERFEQPTDFGFYFVAGLSYTPLPRHRVFFELQIGKGQQDRQGESHLFQQQFQAVSLGYDFRVF